MYVAKGIRKHLHRTSAGYVWLCGSCWTPPPLNPNWVEKYGNTRVNGFPVNKKKQPTSIDLAVGFRRTRILENGEREVYYVKRRASATE